MVRASLSTRRISTMETKPCPHNVEDPLTCHKCFPALHTYLAVFYQCAVVEGDMQVENAPVLGRERFVAKDANMAFNRAIQMSKAKRHYGPRCNYFGVYKLIRHMAL